MAKIGRNDPCPCGSGRKFKRCCLGQDGPLDAPEVLKLPSAAYLPDVEYDEVEDDELGWDGGDGWDDAEDYTDLHEIDGVMYDAEVAPDSVTWLELDEDAREILISAYHQRIGEELPTEEQRQLHAMTHEVVENQLAPDDPPEAREALARFRAAGVDRHSAIHALGGEFAVFFHGLVTGKAATQKEDLARAYASLEPETWLASSTEDAVP